MERHEPNEQLRALLSEAAITSDALAHAVNTLGHTSGLNLRYSRSSVGKWLTGSRPAAPVPALVAEVLTRRLGRTVPAQETGLTSLAQDALPPPALELPATALTSLATADADPQSHPDLHRTPYAASVAPPAWDEARERAHQARVNPRWRVGRGEVDALRYMTHTYAEALESFGGAHSRTALATYLAHDATTWLRADSTPKVRNGLLTGVAELAHLLARMCIDSAHHGLAQRYFQLAAALAAEADNRVLYAITLRAVSTHAHQLHQPRPDLAEAAVEIAPDTAGAATHAFLTAELALAAAGTGRRLRARDHLKRADEYHALAIADEAPFADYPRAGLEYQRAQVFLALNDSDRARTALSASLDHRPAHARRARALTHAQLATILLRTGHLEAACTEIHHCLSHYKRIHSPRVHHHLTLLHEQLNAHPNHSPAQAARHRIHQLTAQRPTPPRPRT